ncbi:MAG: hypothetical protein DWI24_08825 [Planctomycetota bacterium]|nr:MAG: hypothetical protein DWI24_08825 [Planctomycetota bacterium]
MIIDDLSQMMRWFQRAKSPKLLLDRSLERKPTTRPVIEGLSERIMPVVGAFNVPQAMRPSKATAGVVLIRQSPDDIGGCTGTLLTGAQSVLTAAHCVDANGDHIADAPYYYVNFDLPSGRVQMVVPGNRVLINPQWQGSSDSGFQNGHDEAVLQLSGVAPWGNGPGRLSYQLYTGQAMQPGTSSSTNSIQVGGYGYTGDGVIGQNTSPDQNQISSTFQRLMLPPSARGTFTLGNPKTKASIRLNAQGLTADVVQKAIQTLDSTGFVNVQVVQISQKNSPYFGSFDILFRQVDTTQYPYGNVPQLTFRPQLGYSGGAQGDHFRSGIIRPAFPTLLGTKATAKTRFNSAPAGMTNVYVTQLSANHGLALLGEGDSGGPALLRKQIVGVASFFSGSSQYGDYSGWSSISPDLAWIQSSSTVGGKVVIDLATQPVTHNSVTDYVSVKGDSQHNKMIVLVHGRPIFKAPMSSVQSVQIVPRGVPVQFRSIHRPTFTVTKVPNSQRGHLGKVERVMITGQTTTSPAVTLAQQTTQVTSASHVSGQVPTISKSTPTSVISTSSIPSKSTRKHPG